MFPRGAWKPFVGQLPGHPAEAYPGRAGAGHGARPLLASISLVAIYLDPTEPTRYASLA